MDLLIIAIVGLFALWVLGYKSYGNHSKLNASHPGTPSQSRSGDAGFSTLRSMLRAAVQSIRHSPGR